MFQLLNKKYFIKFLLYLLFLKLRKITSNYLDLVFFFFSLLFCINLNSKILWKKNFTLLFFYRYIVSIFCAKRSPYNFRRILGETINKWQPVELKQLLRTETVMFLKVFRVVEMVSISSKKKKNSYCFYRE